MESEFGLKELGTLSLSEAGEHFRSFLRGAVRETLCAVMAEEVRELCGPRYRPTDADCFRSGTSSGQVLFEGRRMNVVRPRVRRGKGTGDTREVRLGTYAAAQDPAQLHEHMLRSLLAGVPSREQQRLHGVKTRGASKSEVSRLWQREGSRLLEEFRSRALDSEDWLVIMLDGIRLGPELLAVVGLGITQDGRKVLLDFEIGSSESAGVCQGLLNRLVSRGFKPMAGHCLFAVTDGACALKKAILDVWPDTEVQRCLVHKERNLRGYLPRSKWSELARLFKRLRQAQGASDGRKALGALRSFLAKANEAAVASLDEAGDDLIRMHLLNAPATLSSSLLSTNQIENPFRNVRRKIGRVSRWRPETDQPSRWLAYALLEAERGFRRIQGHESLAKLQLALKRPPGAVQEEVDGDPRPAAVTPLRATPSAPLQRRALTP
jgi:putative transposase